MNLQWSPNGWEDYVYWQTQDRKTLKRINNLIKAILQDPFRGIGKPEPLKYDLATVWSRRIDEKNRLLYVVREDVIIITECRSHYE